MNDRHPSGAPLPTGSASDASYAHYPAYDSYGQQHSPSDNAAYGDGDPLFGSLPGSYETGMYETGTYDTGSYGTGTYDTGTHDAGAYGMSAYGTGTFHAGAYDTGTYDTGAYAAVDGYATGAYDTGSYASAQWDTTAHETAAYDSGAYPAVAPHSAAAGYDPYAHTAYESPAQDPAAYASPAYDTAATTYENAAYEATAYGHGGYDTGSYPTGTYDTGSYATGAYETPGDFEATGGFETIGRQATALQDAAVQEASLQETASYEATAIWPTMDRNLIAGIPAQAGPPPTDTVHWDTTAWGETGPGDTGQADTGQLDFTQLDVGQLDVSRLDTQQFDADGFETDVFEAGRPGNDGGAPGDGTRSGGGHDTSAAAAVADAMTQAMPVTPAAPTGRRVAGADAGKAVRGRGRKRPVKRSALLTVAVPSVAAMGVCAVAAASVTGFTGDDKTEATAQAAPDAGAVKPAAANNKLDTQLAGLSASADDFRDRASRTQERIDLKERQALERKRKAEEAARKEAARPKFVLPVTQHGLSATFGQAGVNWMSVHTGIDFPVSYGTPVMSATDGTIRTQWNSAYGNMAIVTAPDGTETWYCHLSSTKIRSGSVKAGDQIAYSGNSGNSTGPHLHFEVRPGGGAAVDPQPWLRDHGLNPN
ncbi:Murein DD-endopeptidase MepM and murein hydrolase activator NlpD, contain LysM domain [Streptomyces sp. 2224.1]|uniref:M23 family metallopeptidase n=1 Tax=unclassified Streptomyces TaxID=2593676 RepID=UPI000886C51E|nr:MULTISPECIES: M23 family metallopeptidase [unclassified Streptomyces]PBC84493.1 murein DD-endopeptidase MepM/ murein hydrolase activator NlpD [Streptomyces sp. 2321.6]SDR30021.1 Murein DD-endopeptidase MepM and murein hydrolase activator NlpD, contain LysM domain [Streptomyces sp. KS_16]SEB69665.1 Murein DD-endopeptidase MepM and murein hydrolase activator NlpD, contain LysM domain [Streptomyces sp. 2224.1]SED33380.1 Murein DD-endopeptidase MepM and murein hydrolase activator NlpD, contain L